MTPTELIQYFTAERQGGFLLLAMAVAGFGFAAFLWLTRNAFMAMAWPLVVLGTFQLVIGLAVALRTPGQIAALDEGLRAAPAVAVAAEIGRMDKVNRNFRIVKIAEAALILVGLALAIFLSHPGPWAAVGLGLVLEAAALLAFDAFAHQRALIYTQWLGQLG